MVAVGLGLAAVSYSIVSNTVFVLGTILGERLFYLPTAGLCLAVAALAEPWLASPTSGRRAGAALSRSQLVVGAMVSLATLASVAVDRDRSRDWLSAVSLFEAATTATPRSARAHMELASAYGNAGRVSDALPHFAAALEIHPTYSSAAYNQGNALARAGRYEEAVAAYRAALASAPDFSRAWHNLALTLKLLGRPEQQTEALRGAVRSAPSSSQVQNELGEVLLATGRYEEAITVYDSLLAREPGLAIALFNRAVARHHLGGCAAAIDDYRLATQAPQAPPQVFTTAAGCLRELGLNDEAASVAEAAKVANRDMRR